MLSDVVQRLFFVVRRAHGEYCVSNPRLVLAPDAAGSEAGPPREVPDGTSLDLPAGSLDLCRESGAPPGVISAQFLPPSFVANSLPEKLVQPCSSLRKLISMGPPPSETGTSAALLESSFLEVTSYRDSRVLASVRPFSRSRLIAITTDPTISMAPYSGMSLSVRSCVHVRPPSSVASKEWPTGIRPRRSLPNAGRLSPISGNDCTFLHESPPSCVTNKSYSGPPAIHPSFGFVKMKCSAIGGTSFSCVHVWPPSLVRSMTPALNIVFVPLFRIAQPCKVSTKSRKVPSENPEPSSGCRLGSTIFGCVIDQLSPASLVDANSKQVSSRLKSRSLFSASGSFEG